MFSFFVHFLFISCISVLLAVLVNQTLLRDNINCSVLVMLMIQCNLYVCDFCGFAGTKMKTNDYSCWITYQSLCSVPIKFLCVELLFLWYGRSCSYHEGTYCLSSYCSTNFPFVFWIITIGMIREYLCCLHGFVDIVETFKTKTLLL